MKRLFCTLSFLFFISLNTTHVRADEYHLRFLMHDGAPVFDDDSLQLSSWVIAPQVTSSATTWLVLAGAQYDGDGWHVALHGGSLFDRGAATLVGDTRLALSPALLSIPVSSYVNVQWLDTGKAGTLYGYMDVNWVLPTAFAQLGLETENTVAKDTVSLSCGPHVVVPVGSLTLIGAYQIHRGPNQVWIRIVYSP